MTKTSSKEIGKYLTHLRLEGLSAETISDYAYGIGRLARWLAPVALLDATPAMLYDWRATLAHTPDTISNYVGHARRFYDWAITAGLRPGPSPVDGVPVPPGPRRLPRPIPEDALFDVLAAAPRRIRPWLVLAAWGGLRAKEIAYLRCENVRLGETPPMLLVACDATKGRRERQVPLCDFAAAELAAHRLGRRGWAFTRRDGQAGPNAPGLISILANRHIHDCGYDDTLHALRHRCLTQVYAATRDIRLTQEIAGHSGPEQTALYTYVSNAAAAAAVQKLPVPPRLRLAG